MSKLDGLSDFFNDNFLEFNDPDIQAADSKLTCIRYGLKSYYETYNIFADNHTFYRYADRIHSSVILSQVKSHDFLIRYSASISFIHLSFEQFILEILGERSPFLAKLTLDKQYDVVKLLTGDIYNEDFSRKKNVDYSIALKRVEQLVRNHNRINDDYKIDPRFHFLLDHIETLKQLSILRNDIIHSSKQFLNRYVYECFFVNQLLPLIRAYLDTQVQDRYLERNLACGKNVIDEILRDSLPEQFDDVGLFEEMTRTLNRINHFKELGRASYNNPIHMFETPATEEQREMIENSVNRRTREIASTMAEINREVLGHNEVYNCPCCGTNSLTTFDSDYDFENERMRVKIAECPVCTYHITFKIGEPIEFEIMDVDLFPFIN